MVLFRLSCFISIIAFILKEIFIICQNILKNKIFLFNNVFITSYVDEVI